MHAVVMLQGKTTYCFPFAARHRSLASGDRALQVHGYIVH